MAIVMSFEHWRHYLDGASDVEVFSDHQNLKSFMSQTRLNGRQTRWLIKLLPYDFRIFYRKGALNPADGPSRRPDYLADAEEVDLTPVSQLLPTLSARMTREESQEQSLRPKMGSSNVGMSPITGENLGSKQDLGQGSRCSMGDPSGVCPSMGDPRGISPILEQNLKSKSKLDPGYLPALTAEVIEGNG